MSWIDAILVANYRSKSLKKSKNDKNWKEFFKPSAFSAGNDGHWPSNILFNITSVIYITPWTRPKKESEHYCWQSILITQLITMLSAVQKQAIIVKEKDPGLLIVRKRCVHQGFFIFFIANPRYSGLLLIYSAFPESPLKLTWWMDRKDICLMILDRYSLKR